MTAVPVSVVIPTIGRARLLEAALAALQRCDPGPGEVILVDQSGGAEVTALAARQPGLRVRVVPCTGRGIALGLNVGLREADHDLVLVTHDDCRVAPDWVGVAWRLLADDPGAIVTGRVLPVGDPRGVPSIKLDEEPHDFTGERHCGALYPANMAVRRAEALAFGGFDERFTLAAEDNDFSYRWLRAGRRLRYEPSMVVHHDDWRDQRQLRRLYVVYGRGQGAFYAKHLLRGDLVMLRFIADSVRDAAWAALSRLRRPGPHWPDAAIGNLIGLPGGLLWGLRSFRGPDGGAGRGA